MHLVYSLQVSIPQNSDTKLENLARYSPRASLQKALGVSFKERTPPSSEIDPFMHAHKRHAMNNNNNI
jgi:hypothetical protein